MDLSDLYKSAGKALPDAAAPMPEAVRNCATETPQQPNEPAAGDSADRLMAACAGLDLSADALRAALGDDLEEALSGAIDADALHAFAMALVDYRQREAGRRPEHYTKPATCAGCGPVWLWPGAPSHVLGCPWCLLRARGVLIPRPATEA